MINMDDDIITTIAVIIAGLAILIVYFTVLYFVISTVLLMIYPLATTIQKIAVTFLVSWVMGMFNTTVKIEK